MSMEVSISFYIIFLDVCVFTWTLPSGNLTHLLKITCFNMQNIKVNGPFSSIAREKNCQRGCISDNSDWLEHRSWKTPWMFIAGESWKAGSCWKPWPIQDLRSLKMFMFHMWNCQGVYDPLVNGDLSSGERREWFFIKSQLELRMEFPNHLIV